jgi:hypothetical protein
LVDDSESIELADAAKARREAFALAKTLRRSTPSVRFPVRVPESRQAGSGHIPSRRLCAHFGH